MHHYNQLISEHYSEHITKHDSLNVKVLRNNLSPSRNLNLGTCEYGAETPKYATAYLGANLYLNHHHFT